MPQVGLRLSDEELAAVEEARGDVPREVWLRKAIHSVLTMASGEKTSETLRRVHGGPTTSAAAKAGVKPIERPSTTSQHRKGARLKR